VELLRTIWDFVWPRAGEVGLVFTWAGIIYVWLRRRAEWRRKQFLNQVNFSLNYVEDRRLCIRTLVETTVNEVWLNPYGVGKVVRAAARMRPGQHFILLDDPDDMDFVKRAVLNVLSERFAEVYVGRCLGLPVRTARFCFAVTFETHAQMHTRKFRVLLMEIEGLKRLFTDPPEAELIVDKQWQKDRLAVLREMRDIYLGNVKPGADVLGETELGVVIV
jgi:hypothetical protein